MRKSLALAGTALVITAILAGVILRSGPEATASDDPQDCLDRMFQAAKAGDVTAYLDCFEGELHGQLNRAASDRSHGVFSRSLKDSVSAIVGRSILHHQTTDSGSDQVRIVVELAYDGRPWESRAYWLRQGSGVWKIVRMGPVDVHEPAVPYGTPATSATD